MDTTQCALCVCLRLLYACFNMPLIIGAVMCPFITPIIMKTLTVCCGCMCVIFQTNYVFSQGVYAL